MISQQGEAKAKRGWLRATFRLHLLRPAMDELGVPAEGDEGAEYHVDIRRQTPAESLAEDAKALWEQKLLVKQIAAKLSEARGTPIGRAMVNKALRHWFKSRGLPLPDGRSRRKTLAAKSIDPNLPAKIADEVKFLSDQSLLYAEIAEKLGVHIATVTAAVRYWHDVRGLPVPDGRSRRQEPHPQVSRGAAAVRDIGVIPRRAEPVRFDPEPREIAGLFSCAELLPIREPASNSRERKTGRTYALGPTGHVPDGAGRAATPIRPRTSHAM